MRAFLAIVLFSACAPEPIGKPAFSPCYDSTECFSGYCRGFGCDGPGICIDPDEYTECARPDDTIVTCLCSGETVEGINTYCPNERIAYYGRCGTPGKF